MITVNRQSGIWVSFWRLGHGRREELLWRPLARALGAMSYRVHGNGARADFYMALTRCRYEVVTRSVSYVVKNFRCRVEAASFIGRYTIICITVTPPLPGLGYEAINIDDHPMLMRFFGTCTTLTTVAKSYYILHIRDACLAPFKLLHLVPELRADRQMFDAPSSRDAEFPAVMGS